LERAGARTSALRARVEPGWHPIRARGRSIAAPGVQIVFVRRGQVAVGTFLPGGRTGSRIGRTVARNVRTEHAPVRMRCSPVRTPLIPVRMR
jgi:hypothetical protein